MWMVCPDGLERRCFPLLCMHVVDHKEALRTCLTKKVNCTACEAREGVLDQCGAEFDRKATMDLRAKYESCKDSLLDKDDNILPQKASEVWRVETFKMMGCRSPPPLQ